MSYEEVMDNIENYAMGFYKKMPGIWEIHILPVRNLVLELSEMEGAKKEVVEPAAVLHDIGLAESREDHAERGYELAMRFMNDNKYLTDDIALILKCIRNHSSWSPGHDIELEVKLIQYADALGTLADKRAREKMQECQPERFMKMRDECEQIAQGADIFSVRQKAISILKDLEGVVIST